jgi:hypothetical protein
MYVEIYAPLVVLNWYYIISLESQKIVGKNGNGEEKRPTDKEIGNKIGYGEDYVQKFRQLSEKISPSVYTTLKSHQLNRDNTEPFFEFTEGWVRNSG